jgi:hypothetical protein
MSIDCVYLQPFFPNVIWLLDVVRYPLQVSYVVSSVDHNLVVSLVLDRIVVEVVRFSAEDTARSQLLFVRSSVYRLPVFIWLFPFDSYLFCSPADFAHFDESVL